MIPTNTCLTNKEHTNALMLVEYATVEEKYTGTLKLVCYFPNNIGKYNIVDIDVTNGSISNLDDVLEKTEGMIYKRVETIEGDLHTLILPDIPIMIV